MVNEEAIKNSFQKVKEDIDGLKAELSQIKAVLEGIRAEIKPVKEAQKSEDSPRLEEDFQDSSTGNQGVPSTTTINHQYSSIINNQSPSMINMKTDLENVFRTLTDREFSIFMAVYSRDAEGQEAGYPDIAKQLNISEHTLRGYISSLANKKVPIEKERYLNGKVSLSIKKEFKQLNLYQKLLKLRTSTQGQKTLFDI